MNEKLQTHLKRLGLTDVSDPQATWLALHAEIRDRVTLIDRYELEAFHRGVTVDDLSDADRNRLQLEVLPILFPGWSRRGEASPIDPIVVEDYDDDWPRRFDELYRCLRRSLAELNPIIEHMGSTAVPGLAAKPVIDIMVAVPDVEDEASYMSGIERCGVTFRSGDDGHRYFKPMPPLPRTVQIHVVDAGSEWQRTHLLFRDYLRAHPDVAKAYGDLKKDLAVRYRTDRLAYNAAKTGFILDHMELAEAWASQT